MILLFTEMMITKSLPEAFIPPKGKFYKLKIVKTFFFVVSKDRKFHTR